jgi:hypothetical protein
LAICARLPWKVKIDCPIIAGIDFFDYSPQGNKRMNLDITAEERELLEEIFDEKEKHMIQELNHTDTIDFERMLKKKIEVLEGLMKKLAQSRS